MHASKIPGVTELYLEYLVTLEHYPPIDFTPIFDELIVTLAFAMEEIARRRMKVSRLAGADSYGGQSVDIPSDWGAIQAIIQESREKTEELLRKRKREEDSASNSDGTGKSETGPVGEGEGRESKGARRSGGDGSTTCGHGPGAGKGAGRGGKGNGMGRGSAGGSNRPSAADAPV